MSRRGFHYTSLLEDSSKLDSNFLVNNLLKCLLPKHIVFLVRKIKKKKEEHISTDNKSYERMMHHIDGFSYIKVLKLLREIIQRIIWRYVVRTVVIAMVFNDGTKSLIIPINSELFDFKMSYTCVFSIYFRLPSAHFYACLRKWT